MTHERWQELLGNIKDNFTVEDEGQEEIEDEGGVTIEYIVFTGPLGKVRLEMVSKPVVLDKKTSYTRRIGSETKVDYVYSEDEMTCSLNAYKWNENDDEWQAIDAEGFMK